MKKFTPQPFTAALTKEFRACFKRGNLAVNNKNGVIYLYLRRLFQLFRPV